MEQGEPHTTSAVIAQNYNPVGQEHPKRTMSRHHVNLIRAIFHDPPPHNLHWRDVETLLKHVGASVEPISGARMRVTLNRVEEVLHRPHGGDEVDRQSVLHVRAFLGRAGVTPAAYEHTGESPP